MRSAALSFAGAYFTTRQDFLDYVYNSISPAADGKQFLLVFPAHLSLMLALRCGDLGNPPDFAAAVSTFLKLPPTWREEFLELQRSIARRLQAYLVPGSILTIRRGNIFHEACLISPAGEVMGWQRQLFLSREERDMGWSRGEEATIFETVFGKLGIIIGTDAWYPEAGRVLALKGVEIVCCCGALAKGENKWRQLAGMWQQVQQNQFFCIESRLVATISGREFYAPSLIHAPCEITPGYDGILARGGTESKALEAVLDRKARDEIVNKYPLLKLLNPAAYHCQ